jgi:ribosomal protein L29
MDSKTLSTASVAELKRLLTERRTQLHELEFKVATRQLTKVHQISLARRDIAQLLQALGAHSV